MRLRLCVSLVAVHLMLSVMTSAAEPEVIAPGATRHSLPQDVAWAYPQGSLYYAPSLLAQGWPIYGYPFNSFGGPYLRPFNYSSTFPYGYFYEQYAREAEESRRAADEYEASLAREGTLTGPAKVGAFLSDYVPRRPRDVALTFDGQAVLPSASGAPLVIASGQHTLRISAEPGRVHTSE